MAQTKYTYSISQDFPNGKVSTDRLSQEIRGSAIIEALDFINTNGDVCDIYFKAELTSGDEVILDGIVAAHSGEPLPGDPVDSEGKPYVRAESRPLNCTTYFTSAGDTAEEIGGGGRMRWDASDSTGWTTEGAPSGFKQFSKEVSFSDSIWLKEGTIYYMDCMKDSYLDMRVVCPSGLYYMYLGNVAQAQEDLVVDHYVCKHPMQGNVPMGDELNTEACSQELPPYLIFRLTATVPTGDNSSYGYMEMEMYRQRTVVL